MGSRDRGRFKDCNNKLQRLAGALIQFNIQVDHMITFRNSVVRLFHFIEMLQLIVIIHQSTRGAQDSLGYLTYELFTSATTPFDELGISQVLVTGVYLFVLLANNFLAILHLSKQGEDLAQEIKLYCRSTNMIDTIRLKLHCILNKLLGGIFFIPVNYMLIKGFKDTYLYLEPKMQIIVGSLIIVMFLIFQIYFIVLCLILEQKLLQGDFNKEYVTYNVYLNHAIKLLILLGSTFIQNANTLTDVIILILGFNYFLNYLNLSLIKPVYHDYDLTSNMQLILSIFFACLLSSLIRFSLTNNVSDSYFLILLVPVFYRLINVKYKEYFAYILVSHDKLTNLEDKIQFMFLLTRQNQIIYKFDDFTYLKRAQLIWKHRIICNEVDCPCQQIQQIEGSKEIMNKIYIKYNQHLKDILVSNRSKEQNFTLRVIIVNGLYSIGHYVQACQSVFDTSQHHKLSSKHRQFGYVRRADDNDFDAMDLNIFQRNQILYLLMTIKDKIVQKMDTMNSKQDTLHLTKSVTMFIDSEKYNSFLITQIQQLLDLKLNFIQKLSNDKSFESIGFADKLKQTANIFHESELKFQSMYQKFPSQKLQGLQMFLQAELQHNFMKAWDTLNLGTLNEDVSLKLTSELNLNLYDNDLTYMITSLSKDMKSMEITKMSTNCPRFFGYNQEQFQQIDTIDPLLAGFVQKQHSAFILQFLNDGKSRSFRQQFQVLAKNSQECTEEVTLLMDINSAQSSNLNFIVFLQKAQKQTAMLHLDSKFQVISCSNQLINILYSQTNLGQMNIFQQIMNSNIFNLFKMDHQGLKEHMKFQQKPYTQEVQLKISKEYVQITFASQSTRVPEHYIFNTQICVQLFDKFNVYQVELKDIILEKKIAPSIDLTISEHNNVTSSDEVDDELAYIISKLNIQNNMQVRMGVPLEKKIQLVYPAPETTTPVAQVSQPISPMANEEATERHYNEVGGFLSQVKVQCDDQNLIDKKSQFNFSEVENKSVFGGMQSEIQLAKYDPYFELFYSQIGKRVKRRENIMNNEASMTLSSSAAGIRRSEYFKKYDLFDRFTQYSRTHYFIKQMLFLLVVQLVLSILISSIYLQYITVDLEETLIECDSLQVNRLFTESIEQFVTIRYSIFAYNAAVASKQITQFQYSSLIDYPYLVLTYAYDNIYRDLNKGLQNQYLQPFIKDKFAQFEQYRAPMNSSDWQGDDYNTSIRAVMALNLVFQFDFYAQFTGYGITGGTYKSYFYFLNINYFILRHLFIDVQHEVAVKAHNQCETIYQKWLTTFVVVSVIVGSLFLLELLHLYKYQQRIDRIISWFAKYNNLQSLQQQKELLLTIKRVLQSDPQLLFKFRFDLGAKEAQLKIQDMNQAKNTSFRQEKKSSQAKYRGYSSRLVALIISAQFLVYASFTVVITFNILFYVKKFQQTIDFYSAMSDATVAIPAMYSQRELIYNWYRYPFLNLTRQEMLLDEFKLNIQRVKSFQNYLIYYRDGNFLTETSFSDTLNLILNDDMCPHIDPIILQKSYIPCHQFMDGVMGRGLIATLSYMTNSLESTMAVNNFTNRTLQPILELEAAFLTSKIIDGLHNQLKYSIQLQTNNLYRSIPIASGVFILLVLSLIFLNVHLFLKYFEKDFLLYRRAILLLPPKTLFQDDLFERQVKLVSSQDLI